QYETLFKFSSLTYFSLSIWDTPFSLLSDEDEFGPLTSLFTRCPQLSSIILELNHHEFPYSPSALVATLGDQCVFPSLRRFYAQGCVDPDWSEFFVNPNSHPLRQFLKRHPGIEDLAFGYAPETAYCYDIDPTEMAQLFPSLKSFEGPVFLFKPIVLSALSEQIEKLTIVDDRLLDEVSLTKMYDLIPRLPRLRTFGIWSDAVDEGILVNILRTIVNAAAGQLEEIEIHDIDSGSYGEVMELIAQVRGLRSVTLDESVLGMAAKNDAEKLEWNSFAANLRRTCPRLRTIYRPIRKFDNENREKVWELLDDA
ncbi:hypothetical protein V565_105870, partial [Rhizoctonia solani 123E]